MACSSNNFWVHTLKVRAHQNKMPLTTQIKRNNKSLTKEQGLILLGIWEQSTFLLLHFLQEAQHSSLKCLNFSGLTFTLKSYPCTAFGRIHQKRTFPSYLQIHNAGKIGLWGRERTGAMPTCASDIAATGGGCPSFWCTLCSS